MGKSLRIGILNGNDFTRAERGGGASGFIGCILNNLSMPATVFGIGYSDIQTWQKVNLLPGVSFIPIGNFTGLSRIIPRRIPTLFLFFYHRKRILQSGVDILYIHSPEIALPFMFKRSSIPIVFHQHGSANPVLVATHKWARNRLILFIFDEIYKLIYRQADWIIAIDRLCLEQAKKHGAGKKVSFIMNAVDPFVFKPNDNIRRKLRREYGCDDRDTVLFFAGRLEEVKRVDRIIDSLLHTDLDTNTKLFIAGDGSLKNQYQAQVHRLGLDKRVLFLGHKRHDELPGFYNMADIFLLPSLMEGTPMVVLEALACGTPVIATPVGGIPDLVKDGVNGHLLRDSNPREIARKIEEISAIANDRHEISLTVQRWSAQNVSGELVQLFKSLVENRNET